MGRFVHILSVAAVLLCAAGPGRAQSVLSDDDLKFRNDIELGQPFTQKVQETRRRDIQAATVTIGTGALVAGSTVVVAAVWAGLDSQIGPVSEVQLLGGGAVVLAAGVAVLAVPIIDIVLSVAGDDNQTIFPYRNIEPELSEFDAEELEKRAAREEEVRWLLAALFAGSGITAALVGATAASVAVVPRLFDAAGSTTPLQGVERVLLGGGALLFGAGVTALGLAVYVPFSQGDREMEQELRTTPQEPDAPTEEQSTEHAAKGAPAQP